jgi:hypothetical protein
MKDIRVDHRRFDITVEPERSSPISLYWRTVEAALNCAHRATHTSVIYSLEGWLDGLLQREAFSPSHQLTRRDVPVTRARVFRDRALHEHRRPSSLPSHAPSKLACFSSFGMAPVLVPLRPSNEHILIVRVPGARDQHGCHSLPLCLTPPKAVCYAPRRFRAS